MEEREEHARSVLRAFIDRFGPAHTNRIREGQAEDTGEPVETTAENPRFNQVGSQTANDSDLEDREISSESSSSEAEEEEEPDQYKNNDGEEPRGTKISRDSGDDEGSLDSKFSKGPGDGPGGTGG